MTCETVDLGNGQFAMVCGGRGRRHNCEFCSRYVVEDIPEPEGLGEERTVER